MTMINQEYDNNFDCVWHSWGNLYAFSPVEGQGLAFPIHTECENPTWAVLQREYANLGKVITVDGFDYLHIENPIEGMVIQLSNKDVHVYVQIGENNSVTELASTYDGDQFSLNGEEVSEEEFEEWENLIWTPLRDGEMRKVSLHPDTPNDISLYHTGKFAFWVVDGKAYFCNPTDYRWLQRRGEEPIKAPPELLKLADDAWEITRRVLEILDPLLNESGESLPPLRYSTLQYIERYWGVEVFYEGLSIRQSSGIEMVEKGRWDERFYNSHSGGEEITEENSHRIFRGASHNWKLEIFRL